MHRDLTSSRSKKQNGQLCTCTIFYYRLGSDFPLFQHAGTTATALPSPNAAGTRLGSPTATERDN